jgi:putative ABC transport system permease protein
MALGLLPWEYGVRNMGRSPLRLALGVGGSALVVLLVLGAAAFVRGMSRSLGGAAGGTNVILLGAGSEESIERSEIRRNAAGIAAASIPGIRRRLGVEYASPEIHAALLLHPEGRVGEGYIANFRGVEPAAFLVHPAVRITEGRAPGPGEAMVGNLAAPRMGIPESDLAVGRKFRLAERDWTITGRFEAPGTVMDAEIWVGLQEILVATRRETVSCVVLTMEDESGFADADQFAKQRLDLELVALREGKYYDSMMAFYGPVRGMVWATAILVAAGAFFGGLNTMYAAFAARIRELAALQVLGFTRGALLVGLLQESILTAAAGSLLAAAAGLWLLDGVAVRISMGAFGLSVDGTAMALGLGAGFALGVFGALPPAMRCLGPEPHEGLKAV